MQTTRCCDAPHTDSYADQHLSRKRASVPGSESDRRNMPRAVHTLATHDQPQEPARNSKEQDESTSADGIRAIDRLTRDGRMNHREGNGRLQHDGETKTARTSVWHFRCNNAHMFKRRQGCKQTRSVERRLGPPTSTADAPLFGRSRLLHQGDTTAANAALLLGAQRLHHE